MIGLVHNSINHISFSYTLSNSYCCYFRKGDPMKLWFNVSEKIGRKVVYHTVFLNSSRNTDPRCRQFWDLWTRYVQFLLIYWALYLKIKKLQYIILYFNMLIISISRNELETNICSVNPGSLLCPSPRIRSRFRKSWIEPQSIIRLLIPSGKYKIVS